MPILAFVLLSVSIVAIAFDPNQIAALYFGVPFVIACYVIFWWRYTRRGAKPRLLIDEEAPVAAPDGTATETGRGRSPERSAEH